MLRIGLGVIFGLFAWGFVWFGSERVLSALWTDFGVHQAAFQEAIEHGGAFSPESSILLVHVLLASIVSVISGLMAALIAGEDRRAPLILGLLLLAFSLLKLVMSWPYVPLWYHGLFTAVLLPMTIVGAKLRSVAS